MKRTSTLLLALLFSSLVHAAPDAAAKAQYQAATKAANAEYGDDKKLCAEQSTSTERLQCLKDAKAKYTAAVSAAKANMNSASTTGKTVASGKDDGRVLSVKVEEKEGEGSALGMVAGGVAGALLGHQVGGGVGKDLATIAGAAGGAYAGHKAEQKLKASKVWVVAVRFGNGDEHAFHFDHDPGLAAGDTVKRTGDSIQRR